MKARILKPDFDREYVEELIANGGCLSDIVSEFKTTPDRVEKRIEMLFGHDYVNKIVILRSNDQIKNHPFEDAASIAEKIKKKAIASGVNIEFPETDDGIFKPNLGPSIFDTISLLGLPESSDEMDSSDEADFFEFFEDNLAKSLEYALKQLDADEAVGITLDVDTSATRAALKRLEAAIKDAEKTVSNAQIKLNAAEVKKTEAEDRVERTVEKLRRTKQDLHQAVMDCDLAKSTFAREKDMLEELRKQRDEMQKEIASIELPTFSIVPSGDCIVLKAANYDPESVDTFEAAIKWSRRIGEKFTELTDSEYAVMGRLFGILSKLKGKFKLSIHPSCTNAIGVYEEFKDCFS